MIAAMVQVNAGHVPAYGADEWTQSAIATLREHLGDDCDVAFVFNGTGANCVCFSALCRPWEGVICAETAHVNVDECGAPERVGGVKLVALPTPEGKLTPEIVRPALVGFDFEHHVQPRVISVSNVTELGTVYTPDELTELSALAHANGMYLHVDGARIANAAAALGCSLAALTADAGVDALSLGGTKNGMVLGEAVVLFGDARMRHLKYVRKQSTQLASKMRFIAAQFDAMYSGDLWHRCAGNANAMAARLAAGARASGIELAQQPQANEVFALLPARVVPDLQHEYHFYVWDEQPDELGRVVVRWVTSFDTQPDEVDAFVSALSAAVR